MLQDEVKSELAELNDAIEWAQKGLSKAPEGSLLVDKAKGNNRYYWRKTAVDKKGVYLGKENQEQIRALAQKDYEARLLKSAEKEKALLERIQARCDKGDLQGSGVLDLAYESLSEARKELVDPYKLSSDEYARRWQLEEYAGNSHPFGSYSLFTHGGVRVRSKSEVLIADALEAAGVPYKYERPLNLGGYNPVYPDFTVLNKRTRAEYYWEHFGGMDDAEYREGMVHKLNSYALAGIFPGDRLLATYETSQTPLDTRVVQAVIEKRGQEAERKRPLAALCGQAGAFMRGG